MLRFDLIGYVLGQFLLFLAMALTAPILYGLLTSSGPLRPLLISLFICASAGGLLIFLLPCPHSRTSSARSAFVGNSHLGFGVCFRRPPVLPFA